MTVMATEFVMNLKYADAQFPRLVTIILTQLMMMKLVPRLMNVVCVVEMVFPWVPVIVMVQVLKIIMIAMVIAL